MTFDAAQFESLALNFYQNSALGDDARSTILAISGDPSSLILFHSILHQTMSAEGRFLCLHIIGANVKNGWPALVDQQRNLLKGDFFQMVFQWAQEEVPQDLLRQLDNVLVQILLVEWPNGWPMFLHDFILTSKISPSVMANSVYFLGLLSDQVRNSALLSSRKSELTTALYDNFQMIYAFLKTAFTTGNQPVQIAALISLSEYFQWIDLKSISIDKICEIILGQLMPNPVFRSAVLKLINSVVSRDAVIASPSIIQLFNELINAVSSEISMLEDPNLIPLFIDVFSKFVCLDRCALMPNDTVTQWMIEYTKIVNEELLSVVISMWHNLTKCYIFDAQSLPFSSQFLVPLQYVLCSRMAKPLEFGGDREFYEECSETLNLLFKMHRAQSLSIIVQKLDVPSFTPDLMPWIYSVGALSGICQTVEEERSLMCTIFNILLRFYQQTGSENMQALSLISASFFFIAGQYTRYLIGNQQMLELTLRRLMEAFLSGPPELQFVAVHAFKKIAIGCGQIMVETGFAQRLFEQFNDLLLQTPTDFHLTFFEAITHIVKHCTNDVQKRNMIVALFEKANTVQILTEIIPLVDESFKGPLENLMRTIFQRFIQPEIEIEEKEQLYGLFEGFLVTFPDTELMNSFIQLFMDDFNNSSSHLLKDSSDSSINIFSNSAALSLNCFATIVKSGYKAVIPMLYNNVVNPTYENFLCNNFVDFPDMRHYFFILILAFFEQFTYLDQEAISKLLNYSFFGLKHPQPKISELSMNCITNVLSQLDKDEDQSFVNGFFQAFYLPLLGELIELLFDGLHSALFSQITHTINHLLSIAASGRITIYTMNQIIDFVFQKLRSLFPNCNEEEASLVSHEVVRAAGNSGKLRQILSDFVITSRQLLTPPTNVDDDLLELREISAAPIEIEFLKSIADDDNQLVATDSDLAE